MEKEMNVPYGHIAGSGLVLLGLYAASLYSYLLFHSLVELFSVAVALGTFMVVWNSRGHLNNDFFLLIGISFLFVGILDLIHALAYKGMGIFPGFDANLPTQLWISARYLQSLSLLAASLLIGRHPLSSSRFGIPLTVAGHAALLVAILAAVFIFRIFPVSYIEGIGLTPFKKASEYLICLVLAFVLAVLLRKRAEFDRKLLNLLVASILLTILSELSFTLYISVYGFANLQGHILKVFAMYLIYAAVIEIGLTRPFALLLKSVKDNEALVLQSERLFRTVADFTYDWEYWVDHEGRMRYVTPSCERITGYAPAEFVDYRRLHKKLIHPDDLGAFLEHTSQHLSRKQAEAIDFRIVTRDGAIRWIGHICQPVFDEHGRFIGRRASNRDITEAKDLEQKLLEALELNRRIIEASAIGILAYNGTSGRCVIANAAAARIVGATEVGQLLEQNFRRIDTWKASGLFSLAETVVESGNHKQAEFHFLTTFGREARFECSLVRFAMAAEPHLLVLLNDVGERRQAEEALRKSERVHRSLVETLQEGIWAIDENGQTAFVNPHMAAMLGYNADEMRGRHVFTFMDEQGIETYKRNIERRLRGAGGIHDFELLKKDGGRIYTTMETTRLTNEQGQYRGILAAVMDVTERRRMIEDRELLIAELRKALSKVKLLSGFIPICASCKKIRDDSGYWQQIEAYIREHSEAEFSHGICPDCARKLYPEFQQGK